MDDFSTTATCMYQTQGKITHKNIRSKFLDYQIAEVTLRSDIQLPEAGYHPVSIKVEGTWYKAIASVVTSLTKEVNKTVKVYIHNFKQRLQAGNVSISWDNHLNTSENQKQQDGEYPAAASV